ncbi:Phosphoinositide phosphatase SAC8 [Camellia lanceoleosa]|uniref:Phosphoinositide phosphatase SAC8 n=1 Tax=Camellia lanceoleosa TaxID=1840588 RepID=A0ACC0HMH5_9ERIC|nr:Phosphoinositide phosphatase SAC8 [Camellia lanceoleosa]
MEIQPHSSNFKLWSELELHEFEDKFVIKAVESPDQGFSIRRSDGNVESINSDTSANPLKVSTIYGVAGTIRLLAGTYVLVITSRKEVGSYLGFPVFHALSMKFLSCNESLRLSNCQKRDETYFRTLLKVVESTPGLYFSYETDITLNLQRRFKLAEGWMSKPIWKQVDPRFVWNRNILEELIENKLDGFIIPLLQGNILKLFNAYFTGQLKLKNSPATITLISRRCTRRLGTRMWRRGANLEGDVANFIETEQLLEFEGSMSSFLQIRGSIPLLWEQIVDLSYKPRLNIIDHEQTSKVVERHFHDIIERYGETVAVDLTDKHGDEGQLSMAYATEMEKLPNVRYISFDFHHYCGNSNLDNIQVLYDQVSEDLQKEGYFLVDAEGKIQSEQKGIIRSNCIDCLDRTNVTQSFLAQKSLNSQLQRLGVLSPTECISMFSEDFAIFKTLWVEQGDEISLEYSGTHALKRDLVRYGKQTMAGLIKDGISAISRYYLNNFQDGVRQDAMDLMSGRYTVNRNSPSPFLLNGFDTFSYLPGLKRAPAGMMALVKVNGRQFCSRPRLCGLLTDQMNEVGLSMAVPPMLELARLEGRQDG